MRTASPQAPQEDIEFLVSTKLFVHDPAGTYCVIHEMYNEYDCEAKMICDLVFGHKKQLRESMEEVFEQRFAGNYCTDTLNLAYKEIEKEIL